MTLRTVIAPTCAALLAVAATAATAPRPSPARAFAPRFAAVESLIAHGRYAGADAALDSIVASARAQGPPGLLLEGLLRRGGSLAYVGRLSEAEPLLGEALALARTLDDTLSQCRAIHWHSYGLANAGRFAEAVPLERRLLALARASGDAGHEGRALASLAYADLVAGRARAARDQYRRALEPLRRARDVAVELIALIGLGRASEELGDPASARRAWQDALDRGRRAGQKRIVADAWNNLGGLEFSIGDPATAVEDWQRSVDAYRAAGLPDEAFLPARNLALAYVSLWQYGDAERVVADLRARAPRWDMRADATALLADVRLRQSRSAEAEQLCRGALASEDSLAAKTAIDCRLRLAEALLKQRRAREALAELDTLRVRYRGRFPESSRIQMLSLTGQALRGVGRPGDGLAELLAAVRASDKAGFGSRAITALRYASSCDLDLGRRDSARVRLWDAVRRWEAWRSAPRDLGWREQRGVDAQELYDNLAYVLLDVERPTPAARARAAHEAFDALQRFKARTLEERVRGPGASRRPLTVATTAALQGSALREGELLLDIYAGTDTTLVFAITRDALRAYRLPRNGILRPVAGRFRGLVERRPAPADDDAALRDTAAAALGALLAGPAADLLARARRVLVAADGAFSGVPIAALSLPGESGAPMLAAREVVMIPSATTLLRLRSRAGGPGSGRVLALGLPFDEQGRALPGVARELDWLARTFEHVERRPRAGGEPAAALEAALDRGEIVHVAAHAELDEQRPWRSGLLLAAPAAGAPDPWLRASAIAAHPLPARLCVLASCSSLGTRALPAEGQQGLASAFLAAGVPTVVATLWPVDDASTADFVRSFYGALAGGATAAAALRAAQLEVRAKPATRHPYFWAGFTLVGEPQTRVGLVSRGARPRRS